MLVVHVAFVMFVMLGGLLVARWPRLAWVHVPAAIWGAVVEFTGWVCPLTPLEDWLRAAPGGGARDADFIERVLEPLLYPDWLTRDIQMLLGIAVAAVNVLAYWWVFGRRRAARA